jgi:hypothetical protein
LGALETTRRAKNEREMFVQDGAGASRPPPGVGVVPKGGRTSRVAVPRTGRFAT